MSSDWEKLKVSQAELDKILVLDITSNWAIALSRVFLLRQTKERQSLFFTECSILFLSLLFLFPLSLIVFRKLELLAANSSGLIVVLLSTIGLSILFLIIFNYYLWQKAKRLKFLSQLLTKVAAHNQLINDFQLLANLNRLTNNSSIDNPVQSLVELQQVFKLTKNSLLQGIKLEGFIYRHQQTKYNNSSTYSGDREGLLANLEQNLVNLASLETNSDREYRELLKEAIDLDISVHQQMSKIQTLRRSL